MEVYFGEAGVRICDIGAWSDIHEAKKGAVLNFATNYCAKVAIRFQARNEITIQARDIDKSKVFSIKPGDFDYEGEHALLQAALKVMGVNRGMLVDIYAEVPPGCGTGTSAAISVALLGALFRALGKVPLPGEVAKLAHQIETAELKYESGVQDQYASAYGGIPFLRIYKYPDVSYSPLVLSQETIAEIEDRLFFVYSGIGHKSTDVHVEVIKQVRKSPETKKLLPKIAALPEIAAAALFKGDFTEFAEVVNEANRLQKSLHKIITTDEIEKIEEIARKNGAAACKINGAGCGGTVSVFAGPGKKKTVMDAIEEAGFKVFPVQINFNGLRTWQTKV